MLSINLKSGEISIPLIEVSDRRFYLQNKTSYSVLKEKIQQWLYENINQSDNQYKEKIEAKLLNKLVQVYQGKFEISEVESIASNKETYSNRSFDNIIELQNANNQGFQDQNKKLQKLIMKNMNVVRNESPDTRNLSPQFSQKDESYFNNSTTLEKFFNKEYHQSSARLPNNKSTYIPLTTNFMDNSPMGNKTEFFNSSQKLNLTNELRDFSQIPNEFSLIENNTKNDDHLPEEGNTMRNLTNFIQNVNDENTTDQHMAYVMTKDELNYSNLTPEQYHYLNTTPELPSYLNITPDYIQNDSVLTPKINDQYQSDKYLSNNILDGDYDRYEKKQWSNNMQSEIIDANKNDYIKVEYFEVPEQNINEQKSKNDIDKIVKYTENDRLNYIPSYFENAHPKDKHNGIFKFENKIKNLNVIENSDMCKILPTENGSDSSPMNDDTKVNRNDNIENSSEQIQENKEIPAKIEIQENYNQKEDLDQSPTNENINSITPEGNKYVKSSEYVSPIRYSSISEKTEKENMQTSYDDREDLEYISNGNKLFMKYISNKKKTSEDIDNSDYTSYNFKKRQDTEADAMQTCSSKQYVSFSRQVYTSNAINYATDQLEENALIPDSNINTVSEVSPKNDIIEAEEIKLGSFTSQLYVDIFGQLKKMIYEKNDFEAEPTIEVLTNVMFGVVSCAKFVYKSKSLFVGGATGVLKQWNYWELNNRGSLSPGIRKPGLIKDWGKIHEKEIKSIDITSNENFLFSCSIDLVIIQLNLKNSELHRKIDIKHIKTLESQTFALHDSKQLQYFGGKTLLRTIDYSSTSQKNTQIKDYMNQFYNENVTCIKIQKGKKDHILYVGYESGKLIKWNLDQNDLVHDFGAIHEDMINQILVVDQHGEDSLFTVGYDKVMKMYDNKKNKLIHNYKEIHDDIIQDIIYYRDMANYNQKQQITASEDKTIKLWDYTSRLLLKRFDNNVGSPTNLQIYKN